ncbi:MAG: Sir2 family NAD-dependent protein deacetylase [Pseudomonadota bacterium]|nr:Sir2 family NAD-dependent protein deacetylase [Pseudomonadota bacterium]
MPDSDLEARMADLLALVKDATRVVPFTGAGISTESGIPDFRSPGGFWSKNKPIPLQEFLRSPAMRAEAWRRKFALDDEVGGAKPSRGHRAIARLVEVGKARAVITQNIDGLHQASGVPAEKVIELHGNGTYARCLGCGRRYELDWVRARFEASSKGPDCPDCGAPIKSATISFGQAMPEDAMRRAEAETLAYDLFIAIGSSLVVYPAAGFPLLAKRVGARLAIVNREPTDLDPYADLCVHADIGDALEPLIALKA